MVLKCTFPEQASNSEWARFYYYQGRIKAIQLDYSEAHKYLVQSSRKAPQNSANGFKQHVTKLSITVELLLGNIPERQVFLQKEVSERKKCLKIKFQSELILLNIYFNFFVFS